MAVNITHRDFRDDEFWRLIPGWKDVKKEEFQDHNWQARNSVRKVEQVKKVLQDRISDEFMQDIFDGQAITPMNIRITPYVFSLINWDDPANDPLRKQFLPLKSQFLPDHPFFMLDSLNEDVDSPVPLLTHRYQDKVLFLPLTTCPVYCSYCTRSRIIGGSTDKIEKDTYGANQKEWDKVFDYIRSQPKIEDVVISGGDAFNLTAAQIKYIGESLLNIPHIRRIRYATKGIAIYPQKIISDHEWVKSLTEVHQLGRNLNKQVFIHTHFSSPKEITIWSKMAMEKLFSLGFIVRNQAVLQEGVNNNVNEMILLTRKLSYMNIQPYYVYLHDMVQGCEHLRTTLNEAVELEKNVRGSTAGFNIPTFCCDLPGGGGKRHVASYEHYDREAGISIWRAPLVKPNQLFYYYDPIHKLSPDAQKKWNDPKERTIMVDAVKKKVKL
ncbi:MAG: KamA family radical SAM protein [Bacteriovoracaceae bacterium]